MPRTRRIALVGHPHIVIARGNAGGEVFFEDSDFEAYLGSLRTFVREGYFKLYAYCLMRSELRLVIQPSRLPLAQSIQKLHTAHARRINQRLERTGHLFEGRFRSVIFPRNRLAEVIRGVHLWPVRAQRVRRVETYPWSSHRAYVARGDEWGDLVDTWAVLEGRGATLPVAQRAFARFVEEAVLDRDHLGVDEVIPGIAGDRNFAEAVLAEAGINWKGRRRPALVTLARRVCLLMSVHPDDLTSSCRKQELVMARRLFSTAAVRFAGRSVNEVSSFLARDKAQVSRLVSQGMEQMRADEAFRSLLESTRGRAPRATPVVE
ncbi:MAG: transposase [Myxococcota bacterium]